MKKIILTGLITLYMVCSSYSQNDSLYGFYYALGERHYWQESNTSINLIVNNINHYGSIAARLRSFFNDKEDEIVADDESLDLNGTTHSQCITVMK